MSAHPQLHKSTPSVSFPNRHYVRVTSPEFGVAVRAAEAGAVVNVLIGHQPLQRINRLQTRHTGLPHRQAEALHTQSLFINTQLNIKCVFLCVKAFPVTTYFRSLGLRRVSLIGGNRRASSRACWEKVIF